MGCLPEQEHGWVAGKEHEPSMREYQIVASMEDRLWRVVRLLLAGGLLLLAGVACQSETSSGAVGQPPQQGTIPSAEEAEIVTEQQTATTQNPKLDSALNQLLATHAQGGNKAAREWARSHLLTLEDGDVLVEVVTTEDAVKEVITTIEEVGGEYRGHYAGLIEALVPIDQLASLSATPDVLLIRQPQQALPASPM
jgi:hypothetical protein